jgi:protein-tyrosine-phosphatase
MVTILFACTENVARSQMAAALFNRRVNRGYARACSAGTRPGRFIPPVIVEVMAEIGVELGSEKPQLLTTEVMRRADWLISMGCEGEYRPLRHLRCEVWPVNDPLRGSLFEARQVRDDLARRTGELASRIEGFGGFGGLAV